MPYPAAIVKCADGWSRSALRKGMLRDAFVIHALTKAAVCCLLCGMVWYGMVSLDPRPHRSSNTCPSN